jgi:hypothetical protein
LWFQYRYRES